jgi:hypothetical protein
MDHVNLIGSVEVVQCCCGLSVHSDPTERQGCEQVLITKVWSIDEGPRIYPGGQCPLNPIF